ncbi:MAG: hypothetical protein OEW87_13350 [Flavobacteriaceae bacterium]|nr:hypothetical protein [Flavobacteriaceae bacterium]
MKILIVLLAFLYTENCFAQVDTTLLLASNPTYSKNYGINIQLNGLTKPYFEIGIATTKSYSFRPKTTGFYLASELKVDFGKTILGPKIGVWETKEITPVTLGLSMIYYSDISDFSIGSLRLRPEIGYGKSNLRTYLGANIPITKYRTSREYVNLITFGIMWYIPIIKGTFVMI